MSKQSSLTSIEIPTIIVIVSLSLMSLLFIFCLVGAELVLNLEGGLLLLSFDLIWSKLSPELVEFGVVFIDVIVTIKNDDILLIGLACLESPVERSGNKVPLVNDHELVVHVVLLLGVSSARNTGISHPLSISSFAFHRFVVGDDSYDDASLVRCQYLVGQVIIGEGENGEVNRFLRLADVVNHLLYVCHIWEEESILILRVWSVKCGFQLSDHASQALEHSLIMIRLHLFMGDFEQVVHRSLNKRFIKSTRLLAEHSRKILQINTLGSKIFVVLIQFGHLIVLACERLWDGRLRLRYFVHIFG